MNKLYKRFLIIFIIVLISNYVFAVDPTFNITVRNINTINPAGIETGDTLTFEVWLKWTNYGEPGVNRFEFAGGGYTWLCNKSLLNSLPGIKLDLLPGSLNNPLPVEYRPPAFQIDSLSAPSGQLYLKAFANSTNSSLTPFIVSANGSYGSKLLTFRLVNLSHQNFPIVPFNLKFKLGPAPNTYIYYFLPVTNPDTENAPPQETVYLADTVANHYTVENSNLLVGTSIKVKLTTLFEGRYNIIYGLMSRRDSVNVYLRNNYSPFEIVDSATGIIDSINFSKVFSFSKASSGYYYIVIKHKQCIETWSKAGGEHLTKDTSVYSFDFTSSSSQAYYNNVKLIGSKYCLYSGDVDQNGLINLSDALSIYNDGVDFISGNVVNDLNGDNFVDLYDLLIASSNKNNFIRVRTP